MTTEKSSEGAIEAHRNGAVEAYRNGDMSLFKLAEVLGVDTLSARNLLFERGVRLHEQDISEVSLHTPHDPPAAEAEEPPAGRLFAPREWTIQSYHVDRWIDDTAQDRPYTFEEMKDALARCELLHFDVRHRGYNHVRKKCYEPM
jgi:predicted HTH domain antitoxin